MANYFRVGGSGANWDNASDWTNGTTTGTVPTATDNAYVTAGSTPYKVNVTGSDVVGNLSIGSNAAGVFGKVVVDGGSLLVWGDLLNADPSNTPDAGAGKLKLMNGGSAYIVGAGSASDFVKMVDGNNTLLLGSVNASTPGNFASQIKGFSGSDKIDLTSVFYDGSQATTLSYSHGLLTVTESGITVAILNIHPLDANSATGGFAIGITDNRLTIIACFAAGTHILTSTGEVAVEDLREGDMLVTFAGKGDSLKPVTWIGQRHIDLTTHAKPEAARPVRIRRGAFAEGVPHRDLLVSPDHAVFADGVLIPAKCLVNGVTIVQDQGFEDIHYFHVELAEHDVLLAEGLTVESYLDTGNRAMFENAGLPMILHPMFDVTVSDQACAPMSMTAPDATIPAALSHAA